MVPHQVVDEVLDELIETDTDESDIDVSLRALFGLK